MPSPSCAATANARWPCFEDPNCGYCKRFERDLQNVDNITVYLFLYPILSPDSAEKSRNVWCAKDRVAAWQDMMVREKAPAAASCDTAAIQRNLAFGRKHKITGTPDVDFCQWLARARRHQRPKWKTPGRSGRRSPSAN